MRTARRVRTIRHWKQRFNPNAKFIWRKATTWNGESVERGSEIPEDLATNKRKLRTFWDAKVIELAEFEDPNVVSGVAEKKAPEKKAPEKTDDTIKPEDLVFKDGKKWTVTDVNAQVNEFKTKKEAVAFAKDQIFQTALNVVSAPAPKEDEDSDDLLA